MNNDDSIMVLREVHFTHLSLFLIGVPFPIEMFLKDIKA